ncbi:hypothetical protein AAC387_Pa05g1690 [Persea americana]
MAADFFAGELAVELMKELSKLCKRACYFRSTAKNLKSSINDLLPIIQEIQYSGLELPQNRQRQLDDLTQNLRHGLDLARTAAASGRWNVYKNIRLSKEMARVRKAISRFVRWPLQAHVLADVHHLRVEAAERLEKIERRVEEMGGAGRRVGEESQIGTWFLEEKEGGCEGFGVGMKVGKEKVKEMVLDEREEKSVVGICGMGGSGKTTLVKEICGDPEIRSHFNNRIIFETVSQSPNLEQLRLKIWEQITQGNRSFKSHDSIPQWMVRFEQSIRRPILVVLDDVWSLSQLEELVFKIPGCKTLVVSRFRFPAATNSTYEVELLKEDEALSLFCFSAFGQCSIPYNIDKKLVKQVVVECKGLPLALKVIGASLRGQPPIVWQSAKNRLSRGETISDSHESRLIERMRISIDCLSTNVRECFLDLASFPEDKKIPLDVLINMWVEVHDLEEEDAFAILIELSDKHLLTLVKDAHNRVGDIYSSYSEISVSQHDVLRDLAIHMCNCESINRRKRLIMPRREDGIPKDWLRNKDRPFDAQIVSIHTGEMKESDWFQMYFPNAEVLMLHFSSSTFFLPQFIEKMPKLKALVLINYGTASAVLHNLSVFASLDNLRGLWLEKIAIPPLCRNTVPLVNLRKLSLVLCEVSKSLNGSATNLPLFFPRLSDLTIDHCIDLSNMPSTVCGFQSLESLSITNCHDLNELPPELGRLNSLQVLRLYGCLSLKKLPQAICGLKRLKYLDISQCMNLRSLPEGMDQMISLEKLDMRECSQIKTLPISSMLLRSLGHVICDEGIAFLWKETEKAIPELWIQVAEERFTLDWLVQ